EYAEGINNLIGQTIEILDKKTQEPKTIKINAKVFSELCGISTGKISQYLALLDLPVGIQQGIHNKKINFAQARNICSIKDSTEQLAIYAKIVAGELIRAVDVKTEVEKIQQKREEQEEQEERKTKDKKTPFELDELDTVLKRLEQADIIIRPVNDIRSNLATHYKRYTRVRTPEKKQYLEGFIAALEWSVGFRDN
ncbi:MAG: hypothetical protein PVI90_04785, partial [Desulfobacteraceae bacterium]